MTAKNSSYQKLKEKIRELEKRLAIKEIDLKEAHAFCDEMDVPRNKSGAFVAHRLFWFTEGKRESYKTKENTEGYPAEEHEKRMKALEDVRTAPAPKKTEKKSYRHTLKITKDILA